ncbi:PAS domain-containing protein [Exiguobacterium sp. SH0S2]|uniref:PAS domain-containing protein n=1 Tax=Exiguobacterium sp. SH0S2 TaxID=2510950 RepID=UPI001F430155|nr:PAS domain-containing protein [Exiguobacterium sp. SH0S2]
MIETRDVSLSSPDVLRAIEANMAMIRFDRQRRVVDVNDAFAKAMKYKRDEMIGMQHHLFCTPNFVNSTDYQAFWNKLFDGFSSADKIERVDARGDSIWLEATYMPIYEGMTSSVSSRSPRTSPSGNRRSNDTPARSVIWPRILMTGPAVAWRRAYI